eukprot:7157564-Ditylum_brightwellii.AAC.1
MIIYNGTAVVISDSSYKGGTSTAAATIQGPAYKYYPVVGTYISPGPKLENDPYLIKFSGLHSIVDTVEQICQVHNIEEGAIMVGTISRYRKAY